MIYYKYFIIVSVLLNNIQYNQAQNSDQFNNNNNNNNKNNKGQDDYDISSNVDSTAIPTFDRKHENVTAIIGNTAILPCYINNLGDHKVAWIKVGSTDIIAVGDFRVTNDDRIRVQHTYVTDWSLNIQQVNEDDAGEYICQVNTEPQIIKRISLQVLLPPKIIEEQSTINPIQINEGDTLTLFCHVEGSPTPKVSWYFRKKPHNTETMNIISSVNQNYNNNNNYPIHEGNTLTIRNISRTYSGYFECVGNNSVPPAASRRIKVTVEFEPEITLPTNKVERIIGMEAGFECRIKANPLINHYWIKDQRVIENSVDFDKYSQDTINSPQNELKYEIAVNNNNNDFLTVSTLIIRNLTKADFGYYDCYAVNKFKTVKGTVELKEIIVTKRPAIVKNTGIKQIEKSNEFNRPSTIITYTSKKQHKKVNVTAHIYDHASENDIEAEINRLSLYNKSSKFLNRNGLLITLSICYLFNKLLIVYINSS